MFKRRMKMVFTSIVFEGALYIKGREREGGVLDIYEYLIGKMVNKIAEA